MPDLCKLAPSTSISGNIPRLDNEIAELEKLLRAKPSSARAVRRLTDILDRYQPSEGRFGSYTECQQLLLTQFPQDTWIDDASNPADVAKLYRRWHSLVDSRCAIPPISIVQLFDGTDFTIHGEHTHCDLRTSLFNEKNVISRVCQDCFKVQVLPADLKTLVQVHFIFRILELPRDNFRKCMIELREDIPHPYKAYIFCQSEAEADICRDKLNCLLESFQITNLLCGISHGCSEFGAKYPAFKYSNDGAHRSFERPASWDRAEAEFWSVTPKPALPGKGLRKPGISIRDILGYRTWIDYAQGIGDDSWRLFRDTPSSNKPKVFAERMKKQARLRNVQLKEIQKRLLSTA